MMRGFLGGWIWGTLAVAVGVAALSLLAPPGRAPDLAARAPEAGAGATRSDQPRPSATGGGDPDLARAPSPALPARADRETAAVDTQPAGRPEIGAAEGRIAAREVASEPGAPSGVRTGALPPPAPGASPAAPGAAPGPDFAPGPVAAPAPPQVASPAFGTEPALDPAPPPLAGSGRGPEPAEPDQLAPVAADDLAPRAQTAGLPQPARAAPPVPASAASPLPRLAALPQAGAEAAQRPGIGTSVVPLTERASLAVAGAAAAPAATPLRRYAAGFDADETRPLLAVVLVDAAGGAEVAALADLGFPLSVAIDPLDPDAAARMAAHRAAGREVLAMVDLPRHAAARDAEVLLAAGFDALPETVALLEGTDEGVQGNRALSDQVTDVLRGAGRGLVTRANGLNAMQKRAARSGVPAAVIDRDIDGAGEGFEAILRSLDQAAFRAAQGGSAILLARPRPETLAALRQWSQGDRASRVTLAPVSAVLLRGEGNSG